MGSFQYTTSPSSHQVPTRHACPVSSPHRRLTCPGQARHHSFFDLFPSSQVLPAECVIFCLCLLNRFLTHTLHVVTHNPWTLNLQGSCSLSPWSTSCCGTLSEFGRTRAGVTYTLRSLFLVSILRFSTGEPFIHRSPSRWSCRHAHWYTRSTHLLQPCCFDLPDLTLHTAPMTAPVMNITTLAKSDSQTHVQDVATVLHAEDTKTTSTLAANETERGISRVVF